jgi:hypothetical protein
MIGNYAYTPTNRNEITYVDIELFIFGLLRDICEGSDNVLLNSQSQVNYEGDFNVGDLAKNNVNILLTFTNKFSDPRNVRLQQDIGDNIKVVYEIGAVVQKNKVKTSDFLIATQEITTAITKNRNGNLPTEVNYTAPVPSGKTLSTPLNLNTCDTFPIINISQDNLQQVNYLTYTNNFVITILK